MGALYVMGGAERSGNSSVAAEYNFHCDPEAAHLVLLKVCSLLHPPDSELASLVRHSLA